MERTFLTLIMVQTTHGKETSRTNYKKHMIKQLLELDSSKIALQNT